MRWSVALALGLIWLVATGSRLLSTLSVLGQAADPVIAAAGDIACDPKDPNYNNGNGTLTACRMKATSDLLMTRSLAAVLPLGDTQYETGTVSAYVQSYDPTWGRLKSITRPAAGNHEYYTSGAAGYFAYFGSSAGDPAKGYYSFNVGTWHIIALNSECSAVGGCGVGSAQERWLRDDLATNAANCTLAYWHRPRFSYGLHGDDVTYDAFWRALYDTSAEVILVAHDHDYERFAPQTPDGVLDSTQGIRQFVVGTDGKNHYRFATIRSNSELRNATVFGVLLLSLRAGSYDWQFVPEAGQTFTDAGTSVCSGAGTPTPAPKTSATPNQKATPTPPPPPELP